MDEMREKLRELMEAAGMPVDGLEEDTVSAAGSKSFSVASSSSEERARRLHERIVGAGKENTPDTLLNMLADTDLDKIDKATRIAVKGKVISKGDDAVSIMVEVVFTRDFLTMFLPTLLAQVAVEKDPEKKNAQLQFLQQVAKAAQGGVDDAPWVEWESKPL